MTKDKTIINAVKLLKTSKFGATAIKVELEANLNREYSRFGNGEEDCPNCEGESRYDCEECNNGNVAEEGAEWQDCETCDGEGWRECSRCEGGGTINEIASETRCQDFILRELVQYGLAKEGDAGNHNDCTEYTWDGALKYALFYNDHSVDSEFTFTLSLAKPENIYLLPKIIDAFKKLAEECGTEMDVSGAGMHMALIRDPDCGYHRSNGNDPMQTSYYRNYKASMTRLLPALYFLASHDSKSRSLSYRVPRISTDTKYSAVYYNHDALEFRVFETCYDNPEYILDNVVVIANTMKFWQDRRVRNGLSTVRGCKFGIDSSQELGRLYCTTTHLQLLNTGLKYLKPSYYTIDEVKSQRGFVGKDEQLANYQEERKKEAEKGYEEYEDRFFWQSRIRENDRRSELLRMTVSSDQRPEHRERTIQEIEKQVELDRKLRDKTKLSRTAYIRQRLQELSQNDGRWTLA